MKNLFLLILFIMSLLTKAQSQAIGDGIKFVKHLSWQQILQKAKAENKYIFVDCYTTWCAPCKRMAATIFTQQGVGDFFNTYFINVEAQIDSTRFDTKDAKEWYSDAHQLVLDFKINSFPTFLFFNSDGRLVDKELGATKNAEEFIGKGAAALDTLRQYYTLRAKYKLGDRNKALLQNLVPGALKVGDKEIAFEAADEFIATLENPFTKDNLSIIASVLISSNGKAFQLFVNNAEKINDVMGERNKAQSDIIRLLNYEMYQKFIYHKTAPLDWDVIKKELFTKAPGLAEQIFLKMRADDAGRRKQWEEYADKLLTYYDKYSSNMTKIELWFMDNDLWLIFNKCLDKRNLERAVFWSKFTISEGDSTKENPAFVDTYANLLYKLGKVNEGISWEEKAIHLLDKENGSMLKQEFIKVLEKMRKGVPTWPTE